MGCQADTTVPPQLEDENEFAVETLRNQTIRAFWVAQDSLIRSYPSGVFDQSSTIFNPQLYPAESAISFLSAYLVTGEAIYRDDAIRQLQYARSLQDANQLHRFPPHLEGSAPFGLVGTNAQARLILGYYIAWHVLGDDIYLEWADGALNAFLQLPTGEACWDGQCFTAWHSTYSREEGFEPWSSCFVNPNQNSVIGLVLTLMYHQPQSVFYNLEQIGYLAHQQIGAALVMMDDAGRIPLSASGGDPDLYDTRYGHKTLVNVMWAQLLWQDPEFEVKMELAHSWVDQYTTGGARTLRYYPDFVEGSLPDPTELYCRFPLILSFGGNTEAMNEGLDEVWSRYNEFVNIQGGWMCPLAALDAMGFAKSEYWPEVD